MSDRQTQQILFSGSVQGVGFRWAAERLARPLPLTGYVRNLSDGRVELRISGVESDIDRLVGDLQCHFGDGITGIERHREAELAEFSDFRIRR
jgi:acylphosphatase